MGEPISHFKKLIIHMVSLIEEGFSLYTTTPTNGMETNGCTNRDIVIAGAR